MTMLFSCGAKDLEVLYATPNNLVSCICGIVMLFNVAVGVLCCGL